MLARAAIKARRRNSPRPADKTARGFLQWLRGRPCLFVGKGECSGKIEAMHLDFAGGKGVATKVADKYAAPSCAGHHRRQHTKGWTTFLREVGMTKEDLLDGAGVFWLMWPGRPKWEDRHGA